MAKRLIQDMVRVKGKKKVALQKKLEPEPVREVISRSNDTNSKKRSRYVIWSIAFASLAFCLFAVSFLFSSAEVVVNPKTKDILLNQNLSASRDSSSNALSFNMVIIPGEESKTVQASGEKDVSIKATGTAVIYNAFSADPQNFA